VLALDVEPDMVRYLKERAEREGLANVEARVVAFDDPGLPDGAVDRVLIVNTWHHIADRGAYARKLKRGLAAGGALYVVDFTMETKHGPPPAHRLESSVVVEDLRSAGFEVRVDTEVLSEQYIVIAR
jgi:SAM-dependent methyltransferase